MSVVVIIINSIVASEPCVNDSGEASVRGSPIMDE
jgi:hypothetical protein